MNQLGRIACGIWTPGWSIDFLSVFLFLCFFLSKKKNRVVCTFSLLFFRCLRYIVEMFPQQRAQSLVTSGLHEM